VFQFHSGSIRAAIRLFSPDGENKFQFHSGSIRAEAAAGCGLWLRSFNSTLVRLGRQSERRAMFQMFRFQFHSGSIRADLSGVAGIGTEVFQFHSGSIRAVRAVGQAKAKTVFQFHSGSIRATMMMIGTPRLTSFNSTLVRLGP